MSLTDLFIGISQSSMLRLQTVQNAASKFLTEVCKQDQILISPKWLPVIVSSLEKKNNTHNNAKMSI